jgi:GT2 family glycosyltransferase
MSDSTIVSNLEVPQPLVASVVLPTHGRRASLVRVLRALGQQKVPHGRFEVIVVCDGDIDGSGEACRDLANEMPFVLRVIEQANQGPAVARNRGVAEASAPLIIFIDDDVVPDDGLLAMHLEAQEQQEMRVTIGPLLPPPDMRLSPWCAWEERTLCRQYDDMIAGRWQPTYRQFYTGNASVLKRHIVEAGGFDATYRRAEDVELAVRLRDQGLHFVFLPQARGWHYVQRSFTSWLTVSAAYGAADYAMTLAGHDEVLARVPREFRRRHLVVRALTYLGVGRPTITRSTTVVLGALIRLTFLLGATEIGSNLCSLVFNLRYYHGLATAMGGRHAFLGLLQGSLPAMNRHPQAQSPQ